MQKNQMKEGMLVAVREGKYGKMRCARIVEVSGWTASYGSVSDERHDRVFGGRRHWGQRKPATHHVIEYVDPLTGDRITPGVVIKERYRQGFPGLPQMVAYDEDHADEPLPRVAIVGRWIVMPWGDYVDEQLTLERKALRQKVRREIENERMNERRKQVREALAAFYGEKGAGDISWEESASGGTATVRFPWTVVADFLDLPSDDLGDLNIDTLVEVRYRERAAEEIKIGNLT